MKSFWINDPGVINSNRIIILIEVPISPENNLNKKYIVPIFLWFVDIIHFISKFLKVNYQ